MVIIMKKISLGLFLILLLLFIPKVDAARIVCSSNNMSKMRAKAYKIAVNYEFINNDGDRYFLIRIMNVEKGLEVKADGHVFINGTGDQQVFEFKKYSNELVTIPIEIYSGYGYPCVGEILYTKKIDLPKYNLYSERPECIEYEEFPLCNKWYQGNIKNYEEFEIKLQNYIDSLKPVEEKEKEKEEKGMLQKIIDFYIEHIVYTGLITVVVIVGLGYYIAKKLINRKNRVKIDFKG